MAKVVEELKNLKISEENTTAPLEENDLKFLSTT